MKKISFVLEKLPVWHGVSRSKEALLKRPFHIAFDNMGHIKQVPSGSSEEASIATPYEDDTYRWITPPPGASEWANYLGNLYFDYFTERLGSNLKDKTVLEIGAGSLYIANRVIENFPISNYLVVDPGIREESNHEKVEIIKEYFDTDLKLPRKVDTCLSLNALEHVLNPDNVISKLQEELSENGEAILIFPSIEEQFSNGDFNGLLHEHVNYFTKEACDLLFNKNQFKILDFKMHEDTFYYHLKKESGKACDQETSLMTTETLFKKSITKFEDNLSFFKNEVSKFTSEGKKIVFHGATNGLNNLLGLCELEENSNIEIIDGDIFKKGKYISACQNPIRCTEDYKTLEFDVVFISAMTFYTPIKKSLTHDFNIPDEKIRTIYPIN